MPHHPLTNFEIQKYYVTYFDSFGVEYTTAEIK